MRTWTGHVDKFSGLSNHSSFPVAAGLANARRDILHARDLQANEKATIDVVVDDRDVARSVRDLGGKAEEQIGQMGTPDGAAHRTDDQRKG